MFNIDTNIELKRDYITWKENKDNIVYDFDNILFPRVRVKIPGIDEFIVQHPRYFEWNKNKGDLVITRYNNVQTIHIGKDFRPYILSNIYKKNLFKFTSEEDLDCDRDDWCVECDFQLPRAFENEEVLTYITLYKYRAIVEGKAIDYKVEDMFITYRIDKNIMQIILNDETKTRDTIILVECNSLVVDYADSIIKIYKGGQNV